MFVGDAGLLEDWKDVVEEAGYVPVGKELFGFLREYGGTAKPDVHGVVGEHDAVSVARSEEPDDTCRAHLVHRHTHEALDAIAVEGDVDPVAKGSYMVGLVRVAVHMSDHNPVWVGSFGDQKLRLLGGHRPFLGVGDDGDAGLPLGVRSGRKEHLLVVGDLVLARSELDAAGLDAGVADAVGDLGYHKLLDLRRG